MSALISQKTITDILFQTLDGGDTGDLCAVHLDPAPDNTNLPAVVIMCPDKAEQDAFFDGEGCVDDLAPWKCKVMVFAERKEGTASAQAIFDAVIADLNNQKLAGKAVWVDETEGPTQAQTDGGEFMVATINLSIL